MIDGYGNDNVEDLLNTDEILVYNGSDYQWSSNLGVLTSTGVVRGLRTGVGNTTLRLVMTDSSTIDIDASTLNTSDEDINTRITKAVSLQELKTTYLRYNRNGHLIICGCCV